VEVAKLLSLAIEASIALTIVSSSLEASQPAVTLAAYRAGPAA